MLENEFKIKNLKNVIFLGFSPQIPTLLNICKKNNLSTDIICTPLQKKISNNHISPKVYKKLDNKFENYITNKYKINETLFIAHGSRWIFNKKKINNFFNNQLVNFHCTRLPFDRGGAGVSWKILRNDRIDNLCVYQIDEGIDTGPILMSDNYVIPEKYQLPQEIINFTNKNYVGFFEKFIKKLKNNHTLTLNYQPKYIGRYNPRLNSDVNGWINWNFSSENIDKFIKAFDDPFDGAKTFINNKKVIIKKAQLHGGDSSNHQYMSGIISRHDKDWIVVSTADHNMLIIEHVIYNKKNIIKTLKEGDRFHTPQKYIDNSYKRVKYDINGVV